MQPEMVQPQPDLLPQRTLRGLERVDQMPSDLRRCVHEFGLPIVDACVNMGVKEPQRIRQLVHEIWSGTRETWKQAPRHGASGLVSKLDWLLTNAGSPINALGLVRVLWQSGFVIVPLAPWACMVNASIEEVQHHGILSKQEKHRVRLIAAVRAAVQYAWPHLVN